MPVKLIAHVLLSAEDRYLIIKRSAVKRGSPNVYLTFWDIPGGGVEEKERPRDAAVRECMEETGIFIDAKELSIIHEDSELDVDKQTIFTRLVYEVKLPEQPRAIVLDPEEHEEYFWLEKDEVGERKLVPYLQRILEKRKV